MENTKKLNQSEYEQFIAQPRPATQEPISLVDGRIVRIDQLFVYETYSGLIMGKPHAELNKKRMDSSLSYAREKMWSATEPFLIPPVIQKPRITEYDRNTYTIFDDPEYLPCVTCLAQLKSNSPAKDKSMCGSWLTVVWYQDTFPFPIDSCVLECIKKLEWNNLAEDIDL